MDRIAARLDPRLGEAVKHYLTENPSSTASGLVTEALRAFLSVEVPEPTDELWEALNNLTARVEQLETQSLTRSLRRPLKVTSEAAKKRLPPITRIPQQTEGLLTDHEVASLLGIALGTMRNAINREKLEIGDEFRGFRIVSMHSDPVKGGPLRRAWQVID